MKLHGSWKIWYPVFANDFDTDGRAFIPEVWAQESLMVLEENLLAANLIHRDFENEIAQFGDVVNTRQPGKFQIRRKVDSDTITKQPATAERIQVKLDQHPHVSFIIYDGEQSKSMKDLYNTYLVPAIQALARGIDSIVLAQKYGFLANPVGRLGTDLTKATIADLMKTMDENLVPPGPRYGLIPPEQKEQILNIASFSDADKFGDGGTAIREGSIGNLLGIILQ